MKKRRPQIPPDELHFRASGAEMNEINRLDGCSHGEFSAAFLKAARFGWNWTLDRLLSLPPSETGGRKLSIETADETGRTALLVAAGEGYFKTTEFLLHAGADINRRDLQNKTALHLAVQNGWGAAAGVLIESGANLDLADNKGQTPLHLAAITGHTAITQMLINAGANPLLRDIKGQTPLDIVLARQDQALEERLAPYTDEKQAQEDERREEMHRATHRERLKRIDRLSRRRKT